MDAARKNVTDAVKLFFIAVLLMGVAGCTSMKYTATVDTSLQKDKISSATIAVFPVDDMHYSPPTSCMAPTVSPEKRWEYQEMWNQKMRNSLQTKFENQKWVFLDKDSGMIGSGEIDFGAVKEISINSIRSTKINAMKPDQTDYMPMNNSPRMQEYLSKLGSATSAEYAIVFVTPSLSGEMVTTYSAPMYTAGGSYTGGGGASSQTYYTADVQILVWECATGKLLFSSGGWNKSSTPCFFMPPESFAIDGVNSNFEKKLELIIASLLRWDAQKHVARK